MALRSEGLYFSKAAPVQVVIQKLSFLPLCDVAILDIGPPWFTQRGKRGCEDLVGGYFDPPLTSFCPTVHWPKLKIGSNGSSWKAGEGGLPLWSGKGNEIGEH